MRWGLISCLVLGCTEEPERETSGSGIDPSAGSATSTGSGSATGDGTMGGSASGGGTLDTTMGLDDGPVFDIGMPDMPQGSYVCSSDLKRVLDGDTGAVVQTCPPDQGCLDGMCVPACDAATGAQGSMGCEFIVPTSPFYANGSPGAQQSGPCHALLVANTWDQPATLQLERGGMVYDVPTVSRVPSGITTSTVYDPLPMSGVPAGQVAVVFLSHRPGVANGTSLQCPIGPAVLADTATHGTSSGVAFQLSSDTPIQVYDMLPYGGASSYLPSASLIYPSTAWGTGYLAVSPHTNTGTKWMTVVGSVDGTTLSVQPTVTMLAGSIANPPPAVVTNYTINRGQTLQWNSGSDLVGSIVSADQPIGMFTGNTYLAVSTADGPLSGQDSAHQMIADVNALGSEYVGGGLVTRLTSGMDESVLYRIVGVVDGTSLMWDPIAPPGAPATLQEGEVYEFQTRIPFTVRSQDDMHPFALTQYMSGSLNGYGCGTNPGGVCNLGDDEWVVLVPPQQYLRYYPFFVDPTYGTSTLVVVRAQGDAGFQDVELACMGAITGWQPVGAEGRYEVAHVELFRGSTASVPACATSQHLATSDAPFGIMVWGIDSFASYGYPAGGNLQTINEVDIDPEG
ncbi:MAG: IgGFc-binding protein [Myxococcales bacterium]|nr:IgGFc-binding protein [Myxococcales bacterium]MCB9715582.1 IgGFc-binding protein [Myxococcales bacterium]